VPGDTPETAPSPPETPIADPVVDLQTFWENTCVVRRAGTVWCWGRTATRLFGVSPPEPDQGYTASPAQVGGLGDVAQLALGFPYSLARTRPSRALLWTTRSLRPVRMAEPGVGQVSSGDGFAYCLLLTGGSLLCAGLSDGKAPRPRTRVVRSGFPVALPQRVPSQPGQVVEVSVGGDYACMRLVSGAVACMGENTLGQLGSPGPASAVPVMVSGLSDAVQISCGLWHACAVRSGGTVVCWGSNLAGEIGAEPGLPSGAGSSQPRAATGEGEEDPCGRVNPIPHPVQVPPDVVQVSAGFQSTCAVVRGGQVYCWGSNSRGQLGDGTKIDRARPGKVLRLAAATRVAVGGYHACALLASGGVACWGDNSLGELGDGTTERRLTPVAVRLP
jgi:alpha-tubulin suppressor-like RCC1 family protein